MRMLRISTPTEKAMAKFGAEAAKIDAQLADAGLYEESRKAELLDLTTRRAVLTRAIEQAQQRVESYNFDIRKNVVEYDDVMNTHRDVIYKERDKVLAGESMRDTLPLTTRLVRRGGRVVIVGGFDARAIAIPLNWQRIRMSDITSVPSASFAFHDIYA